MSRKRYDASRLHSINSSIPPGQRFMAVTEEHIKKILNALPFEACLIKNKAIGYINDHFEASTNGKALASMVTSIQNREHEGHIILSGRFFSVKRIELDHEYTVVLLADAKDYTLRKDPLTGALHRESLDKVTAPLLEEASSQNKIISFLFIDLDGFKGVNDNWGHETGDMVLKKTVERMSNALREKDYCFRMGGDEFLIVLAEIKNRYHACLIARRIISAISEPVTTIEGSPISIGASIGIASYPSDGANTDLLIARADEAMYKAKKSGKGHYQLYEVNG